MRNPPPRSCSHQAPLLGVDTRDERLDLGRLEMVVFDSDPDPAGVRDEFGGLLDRLRTVVLRSVPSGRAARDVRQSPRCR
jgi:hypothetical protein